MSRPKTSYLAAAALACCASAALANPPLNVDAPFGDRGVEIQLAQYQPVPPRVISISEAAR